MQTMLAVCHPWQCDIMGHLNTRFYAALFDDASLQFLGMLAPDGDRHLGWADVKIDTTFKKEVHAGTLLSVDTQLVRLGRSSITYQHTIRSRTSDDILAEAIVTSVRFDLDQRQSVEISPVIKRLAEELTENR